MAGSSSEYQRTLTAVVNFLEDAGFHAARNTLLETIAGVHQEESPAPFAAHGSPGGDSAAGDAQTLLAPMPPRAVTSLEHGEAAGESRLANLATGNSNSSRAKPKFAGVKVPWDEAINEYETLEDVGYQRKDISSQQAFLENEVETELDRDTGANASSTPHAHSNAANTSGSEFAGDSDSTCGSSISGAVIDLMPVPSCHMSAPPASPQGGAPMFGRSALDLPFPSTGDTAWDLGPIGIRIAEPVTTPTKSSGAAASDEPRPVLSRVESLSSSFKDFDIECNADDWPSRRVSSAQDGGLQSYDCGADDEVIDFQPTLHSGGASQEGELDLMPSAALHPQLNLTPPQLDLSPPQLDLAPPQLDLSPPQLDLSPPQLDLSPPQLDLSPPQLDLSPPQLDLAPPQLDLAPLQLDLAPPQLDLAPAQLDLAPPPTTLSDLETPLPLESPTPSQEPVPQSDDKDMKPAPRPENIGGFSFPVAATPSETQPDHRLFKSWPSVRSSCTSEVIAASDDDHVAADYADDEYLRSVSKPTSRSTSQNLSEIAKACLRSEEDLIASQQSGLEGWSFAQPKASVSTSGRKQDSPTEPHLVLSPTSPAKPNPTAPTASCISEPSTTTSYNTCLPPGFGMHGHTAAASPQSATGLSHTSTSVSPAAAQQGPGESEGQGSFHGSAPERTPFSASSGKGRPGVTAATGRLPPPATHYPGTSGSSSPNAASAAVSPGLLQEYDPSDQQSEDMTTADEDHDDLDSNVDDDDDEGQETADGEMDSAVEAAASLEWQQLQIHPAASGGGTPPSSPGPEHVSPRYTVNDDGSVTFEYDPEYISRKYEILDLRVYHRRHRTGFEETKDFPIRMHDLIAGRYQVVDFLGSAAFSRAVQALDIKTGVLVCLKIIKNNKDYLDQSLDEIKLLKYVNTHDPNDKFGVVRLYDYFYYKEHLFLVCELLRANLYEFQKYNRESGDAPYFTNARIQRIALQVLQSLSFIHALGLIHSDLKPENILIKSYSKCEVKVIDLGSSCFITDQLSSYVQSRSYRAPEVILGLKYDQKVDIWSLGCILAELSSGSVLFQNDSLATLLARLEGILGPVPPWMIHKGRYANRFYTRSNLLYEKNATTERYELLTPKRTSLRHRVPDADDDLLDFIASLLQVDPNLRPTAEEALQHPWLKKQYTES